MAGAFTHFIVCDVAKRNEKLADKELTKILNKYSQFLFLGAASPDMPSLSAWMGGPKWADLMHIEKTNGIAMSGYDELKGNFINWQEIEKLLFVWLLGYVSHLVVDSTIHPIVNEIVGDYENHKAEHCRCEMTQDSLIFFERKNFELRYSDFINILKNCQENQNYETFLSFWTTHIKKTYDLVDSPNPRSWVETFRAIVDAVDSADVPAIFRHAPLVGNYIYKSPAEIHSNFQEDYEKYYSRIKLPTGMIGTFPEDGFERSVTNVVNAWNELYTGLNSQFVFSNVIKNWNLDNGRDQATNIVTYWS